MSARALIAVAAVGLAISSAARPDDGTTRETGADGLELLVLPVPGARTISLRYVVRAGSRFDPPGKEGLAHLLEHLLLKTRGKDGLDLMEEARAAGAYLNGFTSGDSTEYVLDAPADAFPRLAERLLRAITSPAPSQGDLDREIGVIGREDDYHGEGGGVIQLVSNTLFRMTPPEGPILGTGRSLDRITRDDLIAFYQKAYTTAATTVVVAGATTAPDARSLLGRAILLPPALDGERPRVIVAEPQLPVNERIRAPFIAVVVGYRLDASDREACRPLAQLLQHRLLMELWVERPLLRSVTVDCFTLQGADFVLALGYTPTIEATEVPATMQRVFREAATRPATVRERQALEQRMSRIDARIMADPSSRADEAARAAALPREGGTTPLAGAASRSSRADAARELARSRFEPERSVLIVLSPFEG